MNPATASVVTGVTVLVGEWAKDEPVSIRVVVGGMVLAVGLSVIAESAPDVASKFATLIVLVTAFRYGPAIAYKSGLINKADFPHGAPVW